MSEGYSGKPLWQKLGIGSDRPVAVIGAPRDYAALVGTVVKEIGFEDGARFVHAFFTSSDSLADWLPHACLKLAPDGVLWVSWPKKTSALASDLDEDRLRDYALPLGLVDVKVCAVDKVWSALKFVVRKDRRADWNR